MASKRGELRRFDLFRFAYGESKKKVRNLKRSNMHCMEERICKTGGMKNKFRYILNGHIDEVQQKEITKLHI